MRDDLRRSCDEIWVIDCSPEGHQPKVATRIFQGVQQPICIVLASRSPENDPAKPAKVRFRALTTGKRDDKFKELAKISLDSRGWSDCPNDWRAPFLPEFAAHWGNYPAIESIFGDTGLGAMTGRTWIISPDATSLEKRWDELIGHNDLKIQASLFHPHESGDKTISKPSNRALGTIQNPVQSIATALLTQHSSDADLSKAAKAALKFASPLRYGFRSFDRQWIIPDNRLINRANPSIWDAYGSEQVYFTALSRSSPRNGPSVTLTGLIPDHDHFKGSASGRTFALWKNAAATEANISAAALAELTKAFGASPDPVDIFAYVAALLAHPAYTAKFKDDLIRPGLRVPLTADAALFAEGAALGREVIWLHSFGERFNDAKPAGPPRLPEDRKPLYPKAGTISNKPEDFPDAMEYDAATQRLKIGTGYIDRVPPAVWAYEVSGKQVLRQWFSYRKKNRERPQIGDKRKPSPLSDIQPDHWLSEYTSELINVLHVLGMLVELEPQQANLLERICSGPLISAAKVA